MPRAEFETENVEHHIHDSLAHCYGRRRMQEATDRGEVEVFEIGCNRLKACFGLIAVEHVDNCSPGNGLLEIK